jgi:hypothetical protein
MGYGPAMTADYRPSLVRSFERHLRAENRAEHTIASYLESLRQAEAFLAGRGRSLLDARREDLEAFLGELLQRRAPETVATRYRRLRVLYRWLEEEEEIPASPMARMKPPIVPDQPVPVVPEDGLRLLLAACAGKDFEARRDTAIVMFLLDTGARRAELADLQLGDLDLDLGKLYNYAWSAGTTITSIVALVLLWDDPGSTAFVLTAIALGIWIVGILVVSNVWKTPTYKVILAWDPEALPADWEVVRQRYFTINWIQLATTWAGFALFLVALISL